MKVDKETLWNKI